MVTYSSVLVQAAVPVLPSRGAEKLLVKPFLPADHTIDIEALADKFARLAGGRFPRRAVAQKVGHGLGQRDPIVPRDHTASAPAQNIGHAIRLIADGGHAQEEGFDEGARQPFPERGQNEEIGGGEETRDVRSPSRHPEAVRDSEALGLRFETRPKLSIPNN